MTTLRLAYNDGDKTVKGYEVREYTALRLIAHKALYASGWKISEYTTGRLICEDYYPTRKAAIAAAIAKIEEYTVPVALSCITDYPVLNP